MSLWFLIMKKKGLLCEYVFIPINRGTFVLKMVGRKVFLTKPKHQFIYPDEKNEFMAPNQEKKWDHYVNPHLS